MKDYWTQFAKTGDPNIDRLPQWPKYEVESDQNQIIRDPISTGSQLLSEACDFWDKLVL